MAAITYPLGHKSKSTPAPSATEVLAQAQALGVVLALSDGELRARGNQAGIVQLAQHIRDCKPELVKLLALPPPDPELLALAMAYCNHTGASDKARADWHADIAATPVEQRGELAAYLQSQLPAPSLKAQAPTVAPAPDPKPMPKFDQAQPWRALDREFQAHYWQCPQCKAGGRTRGPLCPTGQQLSEALEAA